MFTNFNLTSKMEFCRCHGVLTEKLNGCSSPRKRSRCDASLRSCASGLETCEGAEPRDGAGGQRARWRAALPRSGPTRPATSNRCTPRGGAHPAPCARGAHGIFFRASRITLLILTAPAACSRSRAHTCMKAISI